MKPLHFLLPALALLSVACIRSGVGFDRPEGSLGVRLELRYSDPSGRDLSPVFDLVVHLRQGGSAVVALDTHPVPGATAPSVTSWSREEDRVVLDSFVLVDPSGQRLHVERVILERSDDDAERAAGGAAGQVEWLRGDVMSASRFDARATAGPDRRGPIAGLLWDLPGLPIPARLRVVFTEPVPAADVGRARVTADGQPVPGTIHGVGDVGGLVTQAVFTPRTFLPFDVALGLAPAISDPSGNPAAWSGEPIRTVRDAGPLSANPGFERDLAGWTARGPAVSRGSIGGLDPVEGERQAVVRSRGALLGYLDVPGDASTLELSVGVLSEIGQYESGRSGIVRLHTRTGSTVVFDASTDAGEAEACKECGEYGVRHRPVRVAVDLVPHRGDRVFLSISAAPTGYLGMNEYAVVVDDVSVR